MRRDLIIGPRGKGCDGLVAEYSPVPGKAVVGDDVDEHGGQPAQGTRESVAAHLDSRVLVAEGVDSPMQPNAACC